MGKFTEGPWTVERSNQTPTRMDDFIVSDSAPIAWAYTHNPANGHLIAAAPDMYAALVALLSRVGCDKDAHAWFPKEQEDAIKALAKARGEE